MIDINQLNENQKKAVLSESKYIRVIAGAGSGKTRVLTMRIAHLIEDTYVKPWRILAITFTNKAANEMKERVGRMLGDRDDTPWISTIHSLCVRILRRDIGALGYPSSFTIMDADDQKTILKEAYKKFKIDASDYSHGSMLSYISNNKTAGITVEKAYELAGSYRDDQIKAGVYEFYMERQRSLQALDFDDLILWTVQLFRHNPDVLDYWQDRFDHILVDEFQDIDEIQYKLIRFLTGSYGSLYVVGDPDQTIYTWRGADVNIIMNFTRDFKDAETIILNENYRSSKAILNGANSVIRNNRHRVEKELFTNRSGDEKITHYAAGSDEEQAAWIASKVIELHRAGKPYRDMAVLYRSNYLSRSLEKAVSEARIPYIIYGGLRFYERQEVKDALCYLRMAVSADDLALQRVINRPRRGIGQKTLDTISETALRDGISMFAVIQRGDMNGSRAAKALNSFVQMAESWQNRAQDRDIPAERLFQDILEESGYIKMLEDNDEKERIENIRELFDDLREYMDNNPDHTLDEYLQEITLYTDRDQTLSADYLQLMTVHAAKGLEFDTVFVSDLNDGIFPNDRAMNEGNRGVEEERRLAYVAFTRARNKLYLTEAGGFSFILQRRRTPSRFINEIDSECIEHFHGNVYSPSGMERTSSVLYDREPLSLKERLPEKAKSGLKKGDQVTHDKFGDGIVIRCDNGIAEIAFAYPHGVKKLMAGHPSLKRKRG